MFYPTYKFGNFGYLGRGRSRKAIASTRSEWRNKFGRRQRIAGGVTNEGLMGMLGAGGGNFVPYSPVYDRAEVPSVIEDFLPTDRQTQNKIFRNIMVFDPIVGPTIDYYCDSTFGNNVNLSGVDDQKILQFYEEAIEASGIESKMPLLLKSYLVFGNYTLHQNWNAKYGYWDGTVIHDPDYVEVKIAPFPGEPPIINLQPNNEWKAWASSKDPRIVEMRSKYDPELIRIMQAGVPYPLPTEHTLFVPRMVEATDYYGTSLLTRVLPIKLYEKAIMDASVVASRRFAGPTWVVQVPEDYEAEEIQEIIDNMFAAEEDPIGSKIAVREGVSINTLNAGGGSNFWNISSEWDFIRNVKLIALGVNEALVTGQATYNTMDKVLDIFLEKLRAARRKHTNEVIVNHMLKKLAREHKFFKRNKSEIVHGYRIAKKYIPDSKLIIPKVEWDRPLEPSADLDYWDLLERLEAKGIPIPRRKYAQAAGYDINETFEASESEILDRQKLYEIKRALVTQAEQMGFDPEGNFVGADIVSLETGLAGGLAETPSLNFLEEEPGYGEGPALELEQTGPKPPSLELPSPATTAPQPEAPAGAGANLEKSRFKVEPKLKQKRTGVTNASNIVFFKRGAFLGLNPKTVNQLAELVANAKSLHKTIEIFEENGLSRTQAEFVQYCAARLGKIQSPVLSDDTLRLLEKELIKLGDSEGINKQWLAEASVLEKLLHDRDKRLVPINIASKNDKLQGVDVLAGL